MRVMKGSPADRILSIAGMNFTYMRNFDIEQMHFLRYFEQVVYYSNLRSRK